MYRPRCAGCDELIFDEEYTESEGLAWHKQHFCCWHCDTTLTDKTYANMDGRLVHSH